MACERCVVLERERDEARDHLERNTRVAVEQYDRASAVLATTSERVLPAVEQIARERDALRTLVTQLVGALRGVALGKITSGPERETWCWCELPGVKLVGCHEERCDKARAALAAAERLTGPG